MNDNPNQRFKKKGGGGYSSKKSDTTALVTRIPLTVVEILLTIRFLTRERLSGALNLLHTLIEVKDEFKLAGIQQKKVQLDQTVFVALSQIMLHNE